MQHQAGRPGHEMRAVEDAERVLGVQLDGREAGGAHRVGAVAPFAFPEHVSLADQHQADVRRWGEVAAGAQRPFLWDPGTDVVVQQVDEPLGDHRADPGGALTELVHADQHPGAHLFLGKRRADTDRVAHQEVALKLAGVGRWDADVLQRAHARRQPVDHSILGNQPVNQLARLPQPGFGLRSEADPLAVASHRNDIGRAQRLAVKCH